MTDVLPHTLMFLGGIHSKDYRPDYDILNSRYDAKRPRLLKNETNYNDLKIGK
jgi:heptose-I-phosphate ethanolaminephosphotransferase